MQAATLLRANPGPLSLGIFTLLLVQPVMAVNPIIDSNPIERSIELAQNESKETWTLGLGAAWVPRYEGGDDYEFRPVPLIGYSGAGRFSLGIGGLRYNLSSNGAFEFGPTLGYSRGRKENDGALLSGVGEIDGGVDVGFYAQGKIAAWTLQANVIRGVGSAPEGTRVRLGIDHGNELGKDDQLLVGASLTWTDDKYTHAFFGINDAQSLNSGLPIYSAGAGIKSFGANVDWVHSFSPAWFTTFGVSVKRLTGDAADSPIVAEETAFGVSAIVAFRF